MLRYKIRRSEFGADAKGLEVTNVERREGSVYDIPGGEYDTVLEDNDVVTFKFWVKDLHSIKSGNHLTSVSNVVINNDSENDYSFKNAIYIQDVIVESASSADNTFTISVDKEIQLEAESLHIETRYHVIRFAANRWEISLVDSEWIEDNASDYDSVVKIGVDEAAYGSITINGEPTESSTVFYYENDSWKSIDLENEEIEAYTNDDGEFSLVSFHSYDETDRELVELEEGTLYYTSENYVIIDFSGTHYFGAPIEKYSIIDDEDDKREYVDRNDNGRSIIESITYPILHMYIDRYDSGSTTQVKIDVECHVDSPSRLLFNYDTISERAVVVSSSANYSVDNGLLSKTTVETSTAIGDVDGLTSLFIENMFPYGITYDTDNEIPYQEGFTGDIVFRRGNFMYDEEDNTYSFMHNAIMNTIQIPLAQKFETDLLHNDALETNFVENEMAKMINDIADLEKDVYIPAIHSSSDEEEINGDYVDCYKIIFNLHFREHRDITSNGEKEEWTCDNDCYWNGTKLVGDDKIIIDLKGRVYNYDLKNASTTEEEKYDYFSYYENVPSDSDCDNDDNQNNREERNALKEYQSDLLSYLGFSNDDVKYQKSKLKKSFLRVSFYDSDNVANQNLLHTSTIFLDAGGLYAKYIKNIDTEDEYKVETAISNDENGYKSYKKGDILTSAEYDFLTDDNKKKCVVNGEPMAIIGTSLMENDTYTVYNVSGVRVNREPMRKSGIDVDNGDLGDDIDELERLRMSSQIVVEDKFSSSNSSEGFYFYNYRGNDNGVFPTEIYMRVEFNHAGYGRTVPFMMPYIRKNEEESVSRYSNRSNKIKTFDDICYDWSELDFDNGNNEKDEDDIGYSAAKYLKYSHIKWKYRYDKDTRKHIYYLDPEVYGEGVTSNNGHGHNIILNLYEGKIK